MTEEMKQWEYRVQQVGGFFKGVPADELEELLNTWGVEGWEVVSTHILEIAERMCDRIGIINQGELIAVGTMEELRASRLR